MKTNELIQALLKEDPTGELEVTVGKTPIHFVERIAAYYDGCMEKLVQDKTNPYYNIVGGEILSKGQHIDIHTLSLEDAIFEDPDMPITIDMSAFVYPEDSAKRYQENVDKWRAEAKQVHKETEEWMKNQVKKDS